MDGVEGRFGLYIPNYGTKSVRCSRNVLGYTHSHGSQWFCLRWHGPRACGRLRLPPAVQVYLWVRGV